jgi:predicted nucleic acid-binding protein
MKVVIDASVALKWVVPEDGSDAARELRKFELIAPNIWLAEVANALWRHVLRRELEPERAEGLLRELTVAPVLTTPLEADIQIALRLANELSHPIYDCIYLALAQRERTHVITADRRFALLVSKHAHLAPLIHPLV